MDCGLPHGAQVAQGQAVEEGLGSCSHRWVPSFCISQSSVVHEHPGPCSCRCLLLLFLEEVMEKCQTTVFSSVFTRTPFDVLTVLGQVPSIHGEPGGSRV